MKGFPKEGDEIILTNGFGLYHCPPTVTQYAQYTVRADVTQEVWPVQNGPDFHPEPKVHITDDRGRTVRLKLSRFTTPERYAEIMRARKP